MTRHNSRSQSRRRHRARLITEPNNEPSGTETPAWRLPRAGILAGQWRRRWDLNPRKTCAFTRFRGVRPRPLGDSTADEPTGTRHLRLLSYGACGRGPALGEEVAQQCTAFAGEHTAEHPG